MIWDGRFRLRGVEDPVEMREIVQHEAHARLFCNDDEVTSLLRDKKEPCALGVPFRAGAVKRLCDKFVRMLFCGCCGRSCLTIATFPTLS